MIYIGRFVRSARVRMQYTKIALNRVSYLRSLLVRDIAQACRRKNSNDSILALLSEYGEPASQSVGSISAGEPIVHEFLSTILGLNFDICVFPLMFET